MKDKLQAYIYKVEIDDLEGSVVICASCNENHLRPDIKFKTSLSKANELKVGQWVNFDIEGI